MSDLLPACPSLAALSPRQRHQAAISVCQFADYDRPSTEKFLLALGLIHETPEGMSVDVGFDGENWFTQAASRANA